MKKLYIILSFIFISATYVGYQYIGSQSKIYRTNIIGITGEPSASPYVEIIYSVAGEAGHNVSKSIMVSPPYLFENDNIIITYDSTIQTMGGACSHACNKEEKNNGYILQIKHQYNEGGAEYFRIINHSTDKPIEYFIAGAQDIKVRPIGGEVIVFPSVYFRNAPICYLLHPERKFAHNVIFYGETLYFEGNRCGDIELTSAWSVDDVMKLYRAEYNRSSDTLLYVDMRTIENNGRMTNPPKYDQRLRDKIFYGTIPPQGQLKGEDTWLLATPYIFDDNLDYEQ
ncbi:hypothetical protein FACS1894156_7410 [Bacteroidia bacterium]|nr:hypothetical protein FACS1894156_7410 [Bacteroidia bacterium]